MKSSMLTVLAVLLVAAVSGVNAQSKGRFAARGGLGTDISGGIAYGLGGSYVIPVQKNYVEFSAVFFGGSYSETSNNGYNNYDEKTTVFVVGAMANYLFGYKPREVSTYFIAGVGLASVSVTWKESSPTDVSLGAPLPGGGSSTSVDGSSGGTVFNLGVGHSFKGGLNLRAEMPIIVIYSSPGDASSVVPTVMVTAGVQF